MKLRVLKKSLTAIAVLAIVAIAASLVYIQVSGAKLLTVQSGSMVPAFLKGDLIEVNRVAMAELAVGDVITFINPHNPKQTITHRIVQVPTPQGHNKIVTKGDANATADTPIEPSAVIGRVHARVPLVGYGLDFVRHPLGLALIIYVPAIIIVAQELRKLTDHYRAMQPYKSPSLGRSPSKLLQRNRVKTVTQTAITVMVVIAGAAAPAHAGLLSQATLTRNTITVSAAKHILLRRIEFECAQDNNGLVNKLPGILLYNPTSADINTGGWYLLSSAGRVVTFPGKTVFDSHDNYDIEPDLKAGIKYSGDFLALFDNTGKLIDAISWGTDTSYLNPSLPGIHDGHIFRRINIVDTNTTADWAVSVSQCSPGE
jgi:signal peptidase I